MPDATADLIRDLDDPAKYELVRSVPVFMAHEREFPEYRDAAGKVIAPKRVVRVKDDDLQGIADRLNREIAQTGHLRPLTVGHRTFSPGFPEQHQPPLIGFAKATYRVERVYRDGGSFLAVVEDEYVMRDRRDVLRQYPYRSIDYDPDMKLSEGTALLIRPPFLKMGTTIVYQYDGGSTVPDMPNTAATAPAEDTFDEAETKAYERCYSYFKKMKYMADAGPANAAPAAPVSPPPAPYAAPVLPVPGTVTTPPAQPGVQPAQYAALTADLAALRSQLAAEQTARKTAECRAILDPLVEHRQFDYQRELTNLLGCADDAARAAQVKYICDNYAVKTTSGGMINVYSGTAHLPQPADSKPDILKEPEHYAEIKEYMLAQINAGKSCQYEDAKAAVLAKYAK